MCDKKSSKIHVINSPCDAEKAMKKKSIKCIYVYILSKTTECYFKIYCDSLKYFFKLSEIFQ